MIDLHTHILPGIDDGASDESVSAGLMKDLLSQGVNTAVFTPHYYGGGAARENFWKCVRRRSGESKNLSRKGWKLIWGQKCILPVRCRYPTSLYVRLRSVSTRYLLTELPFTSAWDKSLWRRLREFISETDYVPVIAHSERYGEVQEKADSSFRTESHGMSFAGKYGRVL